MVAYGLGVPEWVVCQVDMDYIFGVCGNFLIHYGHQSNLPKLTKRFC